MSKAVKTVVAVVAMVVVAYVAPPLAAAIGASGALTSAAVGAGMTAAGAATFGTVVGSALVGAGLGAAVSAVTGGKWQQGALMGAIGGGVSGYLSGPTAAASGGMAEGAAGTANAQFGQGAFDAFANTGEMAAAAGAGDAALGTATGQGLVFNPADAAAGWGEATPYLADAVTGAATPAAAQAVGQGGASMTFSPAAVDAFTPYSAYAPVTSQPGAAQARGATAPQAQVAPAGGVTAAPAGGGSVWQQITSRFTDPKVQAALLLRAAGQLAGSYAAGPDLDPELADLINAQAAELSVMRSQNDALFQERLRWAQSLLGESRYFDPQVFGMQAASQVKVQGERQKQAALDEIAKTNAPGRALAVGRRYDVANAAAQAGAYAQGASNAQQARINTVNAGLAALPQSYPTTTVNASALGSMYDQYERQRNQRASDIGSWFGDLTGQRMARTTSGAF